MWHQIFGLAAVTITAAVIFRVWGVPRWVVGAVTLAGIGIVVFAWAAAGRRVQPAPRSYPAYSEQIAPQVGYDASDAARALARARRPVP